MISDKIQAALNKQINAETYSSYLYQSMAAYFEALNLRGMAKWMTVQAGEESNHAKKIYGYIVERGGRVKLAAIDAPPLEWDSAQAAFEAAYAHEQKVTAMIHKLVKLAATEDDTATGIFLQWFVNEQVEEEANADAIVRKFKMVGSGGQVLYLLDRELGQRGS